MKPDEATNEDDELDDFEDAVPPGSDDADEQAAPAAAKPGGFSSGPPWARKALIVGVLVLALILLVKVTHRGGGGSSEPDAGPATSTTVASVDPLANRPKVNAVVSAVVGKSPEARQRIADVVNRAEKQGAELCSLYWGMTGQGWSIEYQRPGGSAVPNQTYSVPVFVDTRCFPTPTSPLLTYQAITAVVTTTTPGQPAAVYHPPLNPTTDK